MGDADATDRETGRDPEALSSTAQESIDRIASFFFVAGAVLLFLSAFLLTVRGAEKLLQSHFERVVKESIQIEASPRPPGEIIRDNLKERVENSVWVHTWGAAVNVIVMARDEQSWLYVNGRASHLRYRNRDPKIMTEIHSRLLPATAAVTTSIEHTAPLFISILIVYAGVFLTGFFVHNRKVVDRHMRFINDARESRDQAARTAERIERDLDAVRTQLREVEPAAEKDRDEIARLQAEQQELRTRFESLAARERALRSQADRVAVLEQDSRALEELLDEATANLEAKDAEVRRLTKSLKRSEKGTSAAGRKSKASEVFAKRIRTFYPQVDIDDRAIDDIEALPDEITRLRAEECIKRLAEEADNLLVRRKVRALRNQLPIYEVGFAGKRRLYYARTKSGRFRILAIGAKNTQQNDMYYLETFARGEFV